jgi:hypothetical protein
MLREGDRAASAAEREQQEYQKQSLCHGSKSYCNFPHASAKLRESANHQFALTQRP